MLRAWTSWLLILALLLGVGSFAVAEEPLDTTESLIEVPVEVFEEVPEDLPEPTITEPTIDDFIDDPVVDPALPSESSADDGVEITPEPESVVEASTEEVPIAVQAAALTAPVLTATKNSDTGIYVSWTAVAGAVDYVLERCPRNNNWVTLAAVTATARQNNNLVATETYTFRVRARDAQGVFSPYSNEFVVEMTPAAPVVDLTAPTFDSIEDLGGGSVMVTWSAVEGAAGYELYRAKDGGSYGSAMVVATTYRRNNNLIDGSTYAFKVRAYRTVDGVTEYSDYSGVESITVGMSLSLDAPVLQSTDRGNQGVLLGWNAVADADGYRLYRALGSGEYSLVQTTTSLQYVPLYEGNNAVTYKIVAYATVSGQEVVSPFSNEVSIAANRLPLGAPEILSAQWNAISALNITWTAVPGAYRYEIATVSNGNYTVLSYPIKNTGSLYGLLSGITHSLAVRATRNVNGTELKGPFSEIYTAYTPYEGMDNVIIDYISIEPTSTKNMLIFKVPNASQLHCDMYVLERSVNGGTFSVLKSFGSYLVGSDITTFEYTDSAITAGNAYAYRVRGRRDFPGGTSEYGPYSKTVSAYLPIGNRLAMPRIRSIVSTGNGSAQVTWDAVDGTDGYELECMDYATFSNGDTEAWMDVQDTSMNLTGLQTNTIYVFSVRAYFVENGHRVYSAAYSYDQEIRP